MFVVAVLVAAAGCGAGGSPADPGGPDPAAAQQALTARALASLAGRGCPQLPEGSRLAGLPDARLSCLGTGPSRSLAAGDGRPTVVNLWASWCAPCVREMPLLQRAAVRAGAAARFVGVDTQDERASAAALLVATGVRYENFEDPEGVVRSRVRAVGLPVTLVFDSAGREVARRFGQIRGSWLDDALLRAGVPLAASPAPVATGAG